MFPHPLSNPKPSTMNAKWILLVAAVLISLPLAVAQSRPAEPSKSDDSSHKFTIGVKGAPGVQLRMLLVYKPSARQAPKRESRMVTTPFQTTVEASAFYVWFDTEESQEQAGARIQGGYLIDDEPQGGGFGATMKPANRQTFGFGTL